MSKDHHAEGQHDHEEGEYNPPNTINPWDATLYGDDVWNKMKDENDEYDAGWKNAEKQK